MMFANRRVGLYRQKYSFGTPRIAHMLPLCCNGILMEG
jgi:hypothetical protein